MTRDMLGEQSASSQREVPSLFPLTRPLPVRDFDVRMLYRDLGIRAGRGAHRRSERAIT